MAGFMAALGKWSRRFVVSLLFILAVMWLLAKSDDRHSSPSSDRQLPPSGDPVAERKSNACYMAQQFVRDTLRAPASATFYPCPEAATTVEGYVVSVVVVVDAQNVYGVMLRGRYFVKVEELSRHNWRLIGMVDMNR